MNLLKSISHALNGIRYSSINETNFRFHLFATFTIVLAGFCFEMSSAEWLSVVICCMLVLAAEMVNTALETLCNCVTQGYSPAIKLVKDIAAGAVLLTSLGSLIVTAIIFTPKIIFLFN